VQLHHAGPGDLMGRQRVARQGVPVDQNDVVSLPGQQECGGRSGGSGPNDNDVVAVAN
jgi:hypothetical protein